MNFRSKYCIENGLKVTFVESDGYCFLKAVLKSLLLDHRFVISFKNLKEKITEYLIHNYQKYIAYHEDSADRLVYEATNFFNDATRFTTDIVDVLIKATADTLNLKIKIFRKSPAGNIQCEIVQAENPTREIMLEFTSPEGVPATYTGANHYNSVSRINPTSNFRLESIENSQMGEAGAGGQASLSSPTEEEGSLDSNGIAASGSNVDEESHNHMIPENGSILEDNVCGPISFSVRDRTRSSSFTGFQSLPSFNILFECFVNNLHSLQDCYFCF